LSGKRDHARKRKTQHAKHAQTMPYLTADANADRSGNGGNPPIFSTYICSHGGACDKRSWGNQRCC
jgi:hypothetical protein